ncbi:MAG: hypothetical protein KF901_32445, partial [Myxococcales bacterium]|nr:hypothetical protein [Myxococcales bacterium]
MASRPADLGLAAWLTPLVTRRRVLWIGDSASGGPELLASHAELVRVLDTTGRARRRRGGAVRVSPFRPGPIELAGDSFELAVIPEIAAFEDLRARMGDLARILGEDGWIVAGTEARGDAAYEDLRDALGDLFREVKVVGQSPFRGVALADLSLADDAIEIAIDGSLLGEAPLDRIYAVAGEELPRLDDYLVVQLPSDSAAATSVDLPAVGADGGARTSPGTNHAALEEALVGRAREVDALRDAFERAEARLSQLQARLVGTEAELAEARAALRDGSADEEAAQEVARLEAKLRDRGVRVRELEGELRHAQGVLRDAVEELREHQLGRRRGGGAALLDAESARAEAELALDELRLALVAKDEELQG